MTIKQINDILKAAPIDALPLLIKTYHNDNRKGVQTAVQSAQRKIDAHQRLHDKLNRMSDFDRSYGDVVIGLDEAGRGPLAGPVVTAACIIQPSPELLGLDDSKKLTEQMRHQLYDIILKQAVYYDIAVIDSKVIDDINILEATKLGMKKSLENADTLYDVILTDYVFLDDVKRPLHGIVKGDQKSLSIAAASVLAKVTRDRLMVEYDTVYSGYGFSKHKGYGTKAHYQAIDKLGLSSIHRRTFLKDYL